MKRMLDPEFLSPESMDVVGRALSSEIERRELLRKAGRWGGGLLLAASLGAVASSCGSKGPTAAGISTTPATVPAKPATQPGPADLGVATGQDAGVLARKAVDAIGGMGRFVKSGNVVVVKPNASFFGGVELATSTHPDVVAAVVSMCREAGAKRVIVMDHTLRGAGDACLGSNGIGVAVERAGGEVLAYGAGDRGHGVEVEIPQGVAIKAASIYPEVMSADVVITVPRAKHHSGAGLTLGMKNFIGVLTDMSSIHNFGLHQAVADLNTLVRPDLSVIDASVILLENGPGGPGRTRQAGTVIASADVVAADSYACTLFEKSASDVPYILLGESAGLGTSDFNALRIVRV